MQKVHIGPLPPPLGGISVYLYRLSKIEKNSKFRRFRHSILWLLRQPFSIKKKIFIYHNHSLLVRFFFYILSCVSIHEFALVIHGRSLIYQYNHSHQLTKHLIFKMLNKTSFIQVVNPEYKNFLLQIHIKNIIIIKNAFIPPPIYEENLILKTYNIEVTNFLKNKNPIIIANAFSIIFNENQDLYGIDLSIQLTKLLVNDFPNIGFLFSLADHESELEYFRKMQKKITHLEINDNFIFMTGQKELWPLLKRADLLVRPTNTDGDSVSIREAIYFNTPVVASDVTQRPQKCILFKNRDLQDFYTKTKSVLINN